MKQYVALLGTLHAHALLLALCFWQGLSWVLQALKHPEQAGPSPAVLAGLARPAEEAPAASRVRLAAGTSEASAEEEVQGPEPTGSLVEEDLRSMAESIAVSAGPGHCTSLLSGRVQARPAHGMSACNDVGALLESWSGKCLSSTSDQM